MSDNSCPTRSKLGITRHPKTLDGIVPLPQIEQGLDRARARPDMREAVDGFRQQARELCKSADKSASRASACEVGDGKGEAIAAFLQPVCSQLDLDEKGTADLAAFTRKLLSGGRPKRGSHSQHLRNVDLD